MDQSWLQAAIEDFPGPVDSRRIAPKFDEFPDEIADNSAEEAEEDKVADNPAKEAEENEKRKKLKKYPHRSIQGLLPNLTNFQTKNHRMKMKTMFLHEQ